MHITNPSVATDDREGASIARGSVIAATPATSDALDESFHGHH
jgi:hypothetical protein